MTDNPKPDTPPVPDPPVDPPVEPPTDPVEPPKSDAADSVEDVLAKLVETVDGLKEVVEGLVPAPGDPITELPGDGQPIQDETPAKKPWHKRGLFN